MNHRTHCGINTIAVPFGTVFVFFSSLLKSAAGVAIPEKNQGDEIMNTIYLDHAASTPVHPEVVETMLRVMKEHYGNASSVHALGRAAKRLVNESREQVALLAGCRVEELVFTGGGTESDNLALFGAAKANQHRGRHIITTQVEHHAVLHTCRQLEKEGFELTYLPVDKYGRVHPEQVEEAIRPDTILVSVMYANNEVGTIQPVTEIGEITAARGILFHVDAVQAFGKLSIDTSKLSVDLMSFSAHKINGPQGVGALYIRQGTPLDPLFFGGLQERKRRAGTENIAGMAGFAAAASLAGKQLPVLGEQDEHMRLSLLQALNLHVGAENYHLNGHPEAGYRLPHIVNISFPACDTETMLMNLDLEGIAAASGSACSSGSLEPSHVLAAMNLPQIFLRSAIRFSFGLGNTREELEKTAEKIGTILNRLRNRR